jgi:hypothetical protein
MFDAALRTFCFGEAFQLPLFELRSSTLASPSVFWRLFANEAVLCLCVCVALGDRLRHEQRPEYSAAE